MRCLKSLPIRLVQRAFLVILGESLYICADFYLFKMGMTIHTHAYFKLKGSIEVQTMQLCCSLLKSFYCLVATLLSVFLWLPQSVPCRRTNNEQCAKQSITGLNFKQALTMKIKKIKYYLGYWVIFQATNC